MMCNLGPKPFNIVRSSLNSLITAWDTKKAIFFDKLCYHRVDRGWNAAAFHIPYLKILSLWLEYGWVPG